MEANNLEAKEDFLVQRRAPVTLFCAPALVKCGTSEAYSFHKRVVISKAAEGGTGGVGSGAPIMHSACIAVMWKVTLEILRGESYTSV
jgi:hypothetical protein